MNLNFLRLPTFFARLFAVALFGCALTVGAQDSLEFQELQAALRTAYAKIQALEKSGGSPADVLTKSTASANAEALATKERYLELRGLIEALGITAIDSGSDEKTERLIAALNDLRLAEEKNQRLTSALSTLLTASTSFSSVAIPGNPESARALADAMQIAEAAIKQENTGGNRAKDLNQAQVLSLKPEFGVVVLDVGSTDGAKPGMPFHLYREDKPIARVLITDVRKSVSGAVIRELFSPTDKPMVGDRGRAEASNSF